ncbi:MAG: zinc dependent phospholipase C family protein [Geobacteraceae bacterium]|nr:zinc dependent phospholipase C family protein [Geobacteraceae bacterium]
MPKELTHWHLAGRVADGLPPGSRLRDIIQTHRPAYLGGAVLPDTLLHLFRGPHAATALDLAHAFHDTAGNSYAPLIQAEGRFSEGLPPPLLACLLGVISHIEADIVFHPFVYALTGAAGIGRHYQIETAIDCDLQRTSRPPALRHLTELVSASTQETFISACALLFDPHGRLPRSALQQALELHCRLQSLYDRTFWKLAVRVLGGIAGSPFKEQRQLFYPLLRRAAIGCIEPSTQGWQHPVTGRVQRSTLKELTDEAVRRTMALFSLIEAQGSLTMALGNRPGENLLTGLHGVRQNEMTNGISRE